MEKILFILAVVILSVNLSGCGTQYVSDNHTTYNEPETGSQSDAVEEIYNYQKEETKEWYSTTVAISNAIVVEDNHEDNVVYKKKCDSCGYIEPGTFSTNPGSFTGGFYCPNCEKQKTIELETTYSD